MSKFLCISAAFTLLVLSSTVGNGQDAKDTPAKSPPKAAAMAFPAASKGEAKIIAALDDDTTLEFIDTPLVDSLDLLESQHKIPIEVDRRALEENGMDPTNMTINRSVREIPLRSALRLMLQDLDLVYVVDSDVLQITTPRAAENQLQTRVYPVRDIVAGFGERGTIEQLAQAVMLALPRNLAGSPELNMEAMYGSGYGPGTSSMPVTVQSGKTAAVQWLPDVLIVTQSWPNHERAHALLQDLRKLSPAGATSAESRPDRGAQLGLKY